MDLGQGYGEEVDLKISEDELREQILACQQEQIVGQQTFLIKQIFQLEDTEG